MNVPLLLLVLFFSLSSISGEIHNAAYDGDINLVILLLNEGHDPNARDFYGFTVADIAAATGNKELTDYLKDWEIEQQKRPSLRFSMDEDDFDKHFNPKTTFVGGEAVFRVYNNNQHITGSPKKRQNTVELVHESTTTSSSTTTAATTTHMSSPAVVPYTPFNNFGFFFFNRQSTSPPPNPYAGMHPRCLAYHQTYPWMTITQANAAAQYEQAPGYGSTAAQWWIVALSWGFSNPDATSVVQAYATGGDVAAWREVFLVRNPGTREWLVAYPYLTEAQSLVALHYQQLADYGNQAPICYVEAVRAGFSQAESSDIVEAYATGGKESAQAVIERLRTKK